MLLRLFFTEILSVSLKPLTRAHRTIQHFSKNTPEHRTTKPCAVPQTLSQAHGSRRLLLVLYRDGRRFPQSLDRATRLSSAPVAAPHRGPLQNRTAPFNIASIFSLSMLFSKNSGNSFPDPFEKNTSNDANLNVTVAIPETLQ